MLDQERATWKSGALLRPIMAVRASSFATTWSFRVAIIRWQLEVSGYGYRRLRVYREIMRLLCAGSEPRPSSRPSLIRWVALQITRSPFSRSVCPPFVALLLAVAACGDSSEAKGTRPAAVRDSAGVRIVESLDPQWSAEARWTIDSVPALLIGVAEGDPEQEFFRLNDARRLSDGRIVAANGGTSELRYFSADGAYLCSSGRQGAGPGEFDRISWLQVIGGDTLIVHSDGGGGRLSVVGPNGAFFRTIPIPRVPGVQFATPMGMLSSRAMLLRSDARMESAWLVEFIATVPCSSSLVSRIRFR